MNEDEEERAFQALIAEVAILGQERLRANKNLVKLEGVCWDVYPLEEKVLPVFVFEKAEKCLLWRRRENIWNLERGWS